MEIISQYQADNLLVFLQGEMDEYSSSTIRLACDKLIDTYPNAQKIIFDLSKTSFMDSTGIGFLIGRYKKASRMQIPCYIKNPNFSADKILNMSGIYTLIPKISA